MASGHMMGYLKFKIMGKKEFNFDAEELNDFIVASVPYGKNQIVSQMTYYNYSKNGVKPIEQLKGLLDAIGVEIKEIKLIQKNCNKNL